MNLNNDYVFVYDCPRGEGLTIYTFTPNDSEEVFNSVRDKVEKNQRETADRWLVCHGENWRENWRESFGYDFQNSYNNMRIIHFNEYEKIENEKLNNKPLHEITEERFHDLLECLPPLKWSRGCLFESFFMSEAYTGQWRDQVMRVTVEGVERFFTKLRTFDNAYAHDDVLNELEGLK